MGPSILLVVLLAIGDQDSPSLSSSTHHRWFVQPAVVLTVQPASGETYHRVSPNLGGHAVGVVVEAGGFLTRSIALEGQFVHGGTISAPQRFSYSWTEEYTAQNRDLRFEELLRWKPGGTSRLEFVGGGGLAITSATKRNIVHKDMVYPAPANAIPGYTERVYGLTLTGGVDAVFPLNRRISVAPRARLTWVHRPAPAQRGWLGAGEYAFDLGLALRTSF